MEIERKFLLSGFPVEHYPLLSTHTIEQGYLSVSPEVRIRHKFPAEDGNAYTLCIKSSGTLCREEVEVNITKEKFDTLRSMIPEPLIHKIYQRFQMPDGLVAECSIVDPGKGFMYAEVEFPTIEHAMTFDPPGCFGAEVTNEDKYKMKNYWLWRFKG